MSDAEPISSSGGRRPFRGDAWPRSPIYDSAAVYEGSDSAEQPRYRRDVRTDIQQLSQNNASSHAALRARKTGAGCADPPISFGVVAGVVQPVSRRGMQFMDKARWIPRQEDLARRFFGCRNHGWVLLNR